MAVIPELVVVALDFYREPRRFPHLTDPRFPLPLGITELLTAPADVFSDENIDESAATLNATVNECRELVPFFIKQVLLDSGGDYYRILGLARDADTHQIKKHYQYLIRLFHPDRDLSDDNWDDLNAPRINEAYNTLRNAHKRSVYDANLPVKDDVAFSPTSARQPQSRPGTRHQIYTSAAEKSSMSPLAKKLALGLVMLVIIGFSVLILSQSRQPELRVVDNEESIKEGSSSVSDDQPVPESDLLHETETARLQSKTAQQAEQTIEADPVEVEQQPGQSMEEMIKLRVQQATAEVVGQPVTSVPARDVVAKQSKLPRPIPEKVIVSEQPKQGRPTSEKSSSDVVVSSKATGVNDISESNSAVASSASISHSVTSDPAMNVAVEQTNLSRSVPVESSVNHIHESKVTARDASEVNSRVAEVNMVAEVNVTDTNTVPAVKVVESSIIEAAESAEPPMQPVEKSSEPSALPVDRQQSTQEGVVPDNQEYKSLITSEQLFKLIAVFLSSYRAGDLDEFVDLFAEDAETTDANGKPKIYTLYKEFFSRPETREISISQFQWKDNGADGKNGSGNVHLVTTSQDGSRITNGAGSLRLEVQQYPVGLKIKGMHYKIKSK